MLKTDSLCKRLICLLTVLMLVFGCSLATAQDVIPEPTISPDAAKYDPAHPQDLQADQLNAASAILIEARSGEVIFEKNADAVMYPASTTKILTVLLGIQMADDLDAMVTVSETALAIPEDSSTMGLSAGEQIRLRDVLYGTMLVSANEGANVIAENTAGSIDRFVDLMNHAATIYGCTNTHFVNTHGYHDDNHYTTARDMAIIAREAMQDDLFAQIAGSESYRLEKTNVHRARELTTKSRILRKPTDDYQNDYYYEYATGIKTGSHSKAGYCFVSAAEKDGVKLISVVFYTSSSGRWRDTKKLFEYGFSQYISVTPVDLYNKNPITIETSGYSLKDTDMGRLKLVCTPATAQNAIITATYSDVETMAENLQVMMLIEYQRDFKAPINAGDVMAEMTYFPEKGAPVKYLLKASRSIAPRENAPKTLQQIVEETLADPNPFPRMTVEIAIYMALPFVIVFVMIFLLFRRKKKRRKNKTRGPKQQTKYLK